VKSISLIWTHFIWSEGLHNTISSLSTTTRVHQLATRDSTTGLQTLEENYVPWFLNRSYACFFFYSCLLSPYRDMGWRTCRPYCAHIWLQCRRPVADISTQRSGAPYCTGRAGVSCGKRIILSGNDLSRRFYTCISAWDLPSGFRVHHYLVSYDGDVAVRKDPSLREACAKIST
jgi:hypothetical protein